MSKLEFKSDPVTTNGDGDNALSRRPGARNSTKSHIRVVPIAITLGTVALAAFGSIKSHIRIVPILITLGTVALAALLGRSTWETYMDAPWTRDGTVRVYIVTLAFASSALSAQAVYQQTLASLDHARVNLERTRIRSPVNGRVTNLLAQLGDYATVGQRVISVVDTDSFWVDGYFEETSLGRIHEGDPATVKLMGYNQVVHGHVGGIASGINVPNAQPDQAGLASVNPIFTWVRLAQRVPVRIHIDQVPDGVLLVAGITATVQIDPQPKPSSR
jgi:multidrug resistance efflux pump